MQNKIGLIIIAALMTGCSPIDSVKPFDHQQAAILIKQFYVKKPAQQRISILLPQQQEWKRIDLSMVNQGSPVMLIPLNQTASNWDESIRTDLRPYTSNPDLTAHQFVLHQFALATTDCKQASTSILQQNRYDITYRINRTHCEQSDNGLEIGKVFNGRDAVYVVTYTATHGDISPNRIANLSHVIEKAELVRDPRVGA